MAIQITGIEEIDKKLRELTDKEARRIMRRAMKKAIQPTVTQAQSNAPVLTGQTRAAIQLMPMKRSRKAKSFGFRVCIGKKDYVGDQFYGAFQEYGFHLGKRSLSNRKFIEGKHFMQKAYDSTKEQVKTAALDEINKGLDRFIKRRDKKAAKAKEGSK